MGESIGNQCKPLLLVGNFVDGLLDGFPMFTYFHDQSHPFSLATKITDWETNVAPMWLLLFLLPVHHGYGHVISKRNISWNKKRNGSPQTPRNTRRLSVDHIGSSSPECTRYTNLR